MAEPDPPKRPDTLNILGQGCLLMAVAVRAGSSGHDPASHYITLGLCLIGATLIVASWIAKLRGSIKPSSQSSWSSYADSTRPAS